MGILALIAEFENDIRRERQMDGIKKARERGTRLVGSLFWSMGWLGGSGSCGRLAKLCRR